MIKENKLKQLNIDTLKTFEFNRSVNQKQVDNLLHSMTIYGKLRMPVVCYTDSITGKYEYYIIDGQHMIFALKRSSESKVWCIVFESQDLSAIVSTMATLNNVVAKWTMMDYINTYAGIGFAAYKKIQSVISDTGFSPSIVAECYGTRDLIKKGKFLISKNDGDKIKDLMEFAASRIGCTKTEFLRGIMRFSRNKNISKKDLNKCLIYCDSDIKNYTTQLLIEKLEHYYEKIV